MTRTARGLRVLLVLAGGLALGLGWGGGLSVLAVLVGAVGLVVAALDPGGHGSAGVLTAAAVAWVLRYGVDDAPLAGTLLLAVAAAVHHQAAALAAAVPPAGRVERVVLVRFGRHLGVVLGLSAVVAVLALGVARPGGSVPLELLGLGAAVLAVMVPVLLSRSGHR